MKPFIFLIFFLIFSLNSLAQDEQIKAKKKAKEITYNVYEWPSLNMISYRNVKNKLFNERTARAEKYSSPMFNQIPVFDRKNDPRKDIYRIIAESLSIKKIQELGKNFSLSLYFDYPGNLLEMEMAVDKGSTLRVEDIERVEINLKAKLVKVDFSNRFYEGVNFIPVTLLIDSKEILASKSAAP